MSSKRFGTFEGVFTPSLLSILGVIMYLRLGWAIGQVGLLSALAILLLSNFITIATVLSMSSVVTNIRIGTGGAYSIISKSLGLEAGGAIGLPLYLSQAVSVAFYISGFTETWVSVFPGHYPLLVSLIVWLAVLIVATTSARLAFRMQYVIMGVIGLSLFSVCLGKASPMSAVAWGEGLRRVSFWAVFAVFFPAVTGILAGASMSGELKDPRSSIPKGTLGAVAVSFCIYIALAFWLAFHASSHELVDHPSILMDLGRWKGLVIAGIMGATLSSALSMAVSSPRILLALGRHSVIPGSELFTRTDKKNEPITAILLTALLSLIAILFGTLNSVAGLITMFFLITYGMINITVFIEQSIGIASFRPAFRIPRPVSFLGGVGCLAAMLLINWSFSLTAIVLIIIIYIRFLQREVKFYSPDVRSGMLVFLAERLALAASRLPYHPKIWKPNLIIPVETFDHLVKAIPLIRAVVSPSGRTFCFTVIAAGEGGRPFLREGAEKRPAGSDTKDKTRRQLELMLKPLKEEKLFVETSVIESRDVAAAYTTAIQTATDMFFPPNTLFYVIGDDPKRDSHVQKILREGMRAGLGIIILKFYMDSGFSQEQTINLWIRRQSPNTDLSILMALQLVKNWNGHLRLLQTVDRESEIQSSQGYLERLKSIMRLPQDISAEAFVGEFRSLLSRAPQADINIFGMPEKPDLDFIREVTSAVRTSVLFLRDSKHESAVA